MFAILVEPYFKQPINKQGRVADQEVRDNTCPVSVEDWPRVKIRLHDPETVLDFIALRIDRQYIRFILK